MKLFYSLIVVISATLFAAGSVIAADEFVGTWSSGEKELLNITEEGGTLNAEFIRVNVKSEFERVRFPAKVEGEVLVISGEQGNVSAKLDAEKKLLILAQTKSFQKLSEEEAKALIDNLQN